MILKPLFQNVFISRKPRVANFADTIKITIMFIKKIYKVSIKVNKVRKNVLKCKTCLYFPI